MVRLCSFITNCHVVDGSDTSDDTVNNENDDEEDHDDDALCHHVTRVSAQTTVATGAHW